MTDIVISDVSRRAVYTGSAGAGPYSFSFELLAEGDIAVYVNDTLQTITTDYTVSLSADGTGSITLVTAATASDTVVLLGNKGIARSTDFVTGGDLLAVSLNEELDAQTIFNQQNKEAIDRAIKIPVQSSLSIDTTLPVPQANYILGWNDSGDAILNLQEIGSYQGTDATTTTANYVNRDIVKDSSNNNVYICTAASTAGTLLTNTSYWALLVDAATATSSATAAAASATAAAASETAAAASETAAAASESAAGTSETNAASSASAASTSATAAASSATSAASSATAAAASETAAGTSETNAAASETAAATSASNAATSATNAASSATTATTQASAASTSATNAATSASAASTSASNASTSETNAATSATAAQAALDSIENFYLGASATAPTVDDNGDPLAAGDWYFNTTDNLTYIYNGSSWQVTVVDTSGFVATSGDTMTGALNFGDNVKAQFGASNDLQIYHDSTTGRSYISESGPSAFFIQGTGLALQDSSGNNYIDCAAGSNVRLFHNASPKLATTSTGAEVTGTLNATTDLQINGSSVQTQLDAKASTGKAIAMAIVFG